MAAGCKTCNWVGSQLSCWGTRTRFPCTSYSWNIYYLFIPFYQILWRENVPPCAWKKEDSFRKLKNSADVRETFWHSRQKNQLNFLPLPHGNLTMLSYISCDVKLLQPVTEMLPAPNNLNYIYVHFSSYLTSVSETMVISQLNFYKYDVQWSVSISYWMYIENDRSLQFEIQKYFKKGQDKKKNKLVDTVPLYQLAHQRAYPGIQLLS